MFPFYQMGVTKLVHVHARAVIFFLAEAGVHFETRAVRGHLQTRFCERELMGPGIEVRVLIVPDNVGCVAFASVVSTVNGEQISLQNGITINLGEVGEINGTLEVESFVLVTKCLAPDGTMTILLIQVLSNPPQEPTPTPTATQTLTSTPPPVSVILPNCYKITFLGFTENAGGTSRWRYLVEELSCAQDLRVASSASPLHAMEMRWKFTGMQMSLLCWVLVVAFPYAGTPIKSVGNPVLQLLRIPATKIT